jgi:hypothetical protein
MSSLAVPYNHGLSESSSEMEASNSSMLSSDEEGKMSNLESSKVISRSIEIGGSMEQNARQ